MTEWLGTLPEFERRSNPDRRRGAQRPEEAVGAGLMPGALEFARRCADAAAAVTVAVGLLVLLGWLTDSEALKRVLPQLPSMKANTALAFVASGLALWCLHPARIERHLLKGRGFALAALAIGFLTLLEYATGVDLRIDELLFRDSASAVIPGRPSPVTALAFVFAGAALLALQPAGAAAARRSQGIAAAGMAVVFVGFLGYLYDAELIRNARTFTSMALHTVVAFQVLLLGVLFAHGERGFMRLLLADDAGGIAARRLVPTVVVFGVLAGWLRLRAQDAGLIDTASGVAMLVTAVCGFVVLVGGTTAGVVSRIDRELRRNLVAVRVAEQRTAELARSLDQARNRLALAVRAGQIGVWDWEVASGTVTWDEQMYALYRVPPGSPVRYETWSSAVLPEDLPQAEANLRRGIERQVATDNTFRIRLPDGSVRHIAAAQGVVVEDGSVVRVIGVNRDVTRMVEAEALLKASEEKMRQAFRHSAVGAAIVSLEGRFVDANDALCGMVGYSPAALTATTFQAITHPDDLEKDLELVRRLLAGEIASYQMEKRYLHRQGRIVWVRISVALVRGDGGAPQHFVVQVEDITQRKHAEDAAARALRELESFSYSVAHDLRAPLRAISGFSRLLERDAKLPAGSPAREHLTEIETAAARMGHLIDDLLTLSKVERGGFQRQPVDVTALAREIIGRLPADAGKRRVAWLVEEGLRADADPRLLRIALENLLGNAFKYTSRQPVARIELGARGEGPRRVFFVKDNGVGFDMAYAEKLFKPFQRLHAAAEFEGTGIGLATVQRIIERHGGQLTGEGKVGAGATFTFTLG